MKVTIISIFGTNVLVEFEDSSGMLQRKYISRELLPVDRRGPATVPDNLIQLGVDYSDVDLEYSLGNELPAIPTRVLVNALRQAGIWTRKDYQENANVISGVLQKLRGGIDATTVINAAFRVITNSEE